MYEEYIVSNITDLDGNVRIDGEYPNRIGRVCKKPEFIANHVPIVIEWLYKNDGSEYKNMFLTTSFVVSYTEHKNRIIIVTNNTVYYFKRKNKYKNMWKNEII